MLSEEAVGIEQKPIEEPKRKKTRKNLPKEATDYLKDWMFEHKHYPYPDDACKLDMSLMLNLTQTQINNWFINNRRRYLTRVCQENEKTKYSKRKRAINGSIMNKKRKHNSENDACSLMSSGTSISYEDYQCYSSDKSLQDSGISNSSSSSSPCVDRKSSIVSFISYALQNRLFSDGLLFLAEVIDLKARIEKLSHIEM